MTLEFTNRKGHRYYVLQGLTKTGKPKYYCSRKPGGKGVDQLPPDFEVHEHPASAIVSVRKVSPSRLLPSELEFLKEQIPRLSGIRHFIIDRTGDSFAIYVCDRDPDDVNRVLGMMLGPLGEHAESNRRWVLEHVQYSPAFRFTLTNEDKRLFQAERWCFRSQIDGWLPISPPNRSLEQLARTFLPHLGQESFFELM